MVFPELEKHSEIVKAHTSLIVLKLLFIVIKKIKAII